jgi:hypothetical protein
LNLDYTSVTDKGLDALKSLPGLRELSLDSAGVTDAGVETLNAMPALKSVNLYHTLVSEKGMAALKKSHPDAEFVWDMDSSLPGRRKASEQK